jgi:hypothetical protein
MDASFTVLAQCSSIVIGPGWRRGDALDRQRVLRVGDLHLAHIHIRVGLLIPERPRLPLPRYTWTVSALDSGIGVSASLAYESVLTQPNRSWGSRYPEDQGAPCVEGYDSHYAADDYDGPEGDQIIFFESDQLLPCFVTSQQGHSEAEQAVRELLQDVGIGWAYHLPEFE